VFVAPVILLQSRFSPSASHTLSAKIIHWRTILQPQASDSKIYVSWIFLADFLDRYLAVG
jgi:hypothetical protein